MVSQPPSQFYIWSHWQFKMAASMEATILYSHVGIKGCWAFMVNCSGITDYIHYRGLERAEYVQSWGRFWCSWARCWCHWRPAGTSVPPGLPGTSDCAPGLPALCGKEQATRTARLSKNRQQELHGWARTGNKNCTAEQEPATRTELKACLSKNQPQQCTSELY